MKKISNNLWISFLPFLFLYIIIVVFIHKDLMEGDEGRYYMYAQNLLRGYYSPANEVYLWNGPGYPLLLVPLLFFKLPLIWFTLLNAVFQYISVVLLYKTLILYVKSSRALFFSCFWACYYIAFKEMGLIYTESFTVFLIVAFQYCFVMTFRTQCKKRHILLAGSLLGYIILTKVIFAYVVLALLFLSLLSILMLRRIIYRKSWMILGIALLVNLPYLLYTYHISGKLFYWANSGGSSLYWASSPFKGEYGDWNNDDFTTYCNIDPLFPCNAPLIAKNHEGDFKIFKQYKGVARDSLMKVKAIQNIKNNPLKYVKNYIANMGRMLFGLPQSFFYQRFQNLIRMPLNSIIFFFILFSSVFTIFRFRRIKKEILGMLLFTFIYLAGSAALSADQRQFYIIVPVILLWTAFIIDDLFFRLDSNHK